MSHALELEPARIRDGDPDALAALLEWRGNAVFSYCEHVADGGRSVVAASDAFAQFRLSVSDWSQVAPEDAAADLRALARRSAMRLGCVAPHPLGSPDCARVSASFIDCVEGRLAAEEREDIDAHLVTCTSCTARWRRLQAGERAFDRPPRAPLPGRVAGEIVRAMVAAAPVRAHAADATMVREEALRRLQSGGAPEPAGPLHLPLERVPADAGRAADAALEEPGRAATGEAALGDRLRLDEPPPASRVAPSRLVDGLGDDLAPGAEHGSPHTTGRRRRSPVAALGRRRARRRAARASADEGPRGASSWLMTIVAVVGASAGMMLFNSLTGRTTTTSNTSEGSGATPNAPASSARPQSPAGPDSAAGGGQAGTLGGNAGAGRSARGAGSPSAASTPLRARRRSTSAGRANGGSGPSGRAVRRGAATTRRSPPASTAPAPAPAPAAATRPIPAAPVQTPPPAAPGPSGGRFGIEGET